MKGRAPRRGRSNNDKHNAAVQIGFGVYSAPPELLPRLSGYLGLAQNAGRIAAGDGAAKEALLKGRAVLLVLASDAAAAVRSELEALAQAADLPLLLWPDKLSLGLVVGKSRRGAIALLDEGFAAAMLRLLPPPTDPPQDDDDIRIEISIT